MSNVNHSQLISELEQERDQFLKESNDFSLKVSEANRHAEALDVTISLLRKKWSVPTNGAHALSPIAKSEKISGFPYKGRPIEQAVFVIKEAKRFLVKKEICNRANEILNRNDFKEKLASSLGIECANDNNQFNLIKIQLDHTYNNSVYGFKEWIEDNGKIKQQYKYDKTALPYRISEEDESKYI